MDNRSDVTPSGVWMVRCHFAEHHESGMMFSFNVAPEARSQRGVEVSFVNGLIGQVIARHPTVQSERRVTPNFHH